MNLHEKDAIVNFVEFLLSDLLESMEHNIDPDAIGEMYSRATQICDDLDHTLMSQILYDNPQLLKEFVNIRAAQKKR